jgi:hypothetical protein
MTIDPASLLPLAAWNRYRSEHARRLAAHRRVRSVSVGPHMRLQFEDEQTVRCHIQEVLRAERIERPDDVREEVERCAHLCPDGRCWIATLMIQIPDAELRRARLPLLTQAAHRMFVQLDRQPRARLFALANEDLPDRHLGRDSAVHFLRFAWPDDARAALERGAGVRLGCAYPGYEFVRVIPRSTLAVLRADLAPLPQAASAVAAAAATRPVPGRPAVASVAAAASLPGILRPVAGVAQPAANEALVLAGPAAAGG